LSTAASASPAQQPEQPRRGRTAQPAGAPAAGAAAANRLESLRSAHVLPTLARRVPTTLQLDLHGSRMQRPTIERILVLLAASKSVRTVEILGGAELNPHFQRLVNGSLALERRVVLRCTPELLEQPPRRDLAEFLAVREVTVVAPCPAPADLAVVRVIRRLNALGYGQAQGDTSKEGLRLHLRYRPQGAQLAESQGLLETEVRGRLREKHALVFDRLHVLANMPIEAFAQELEQSGGMPAYRELLESAFNPAASDRVMCRDLLIADWEGRLWDCEFDRSLGLPLRSSGRATPTVFSVGDLAELDGMPIATGDHCLGCTAGQGSGCDGALVVACGSA